MAVAAVADFNQYLELRHPDGNVAVPAFAFYLNDIASKTGDQVRHTGKIAGDH